MEPNSSKNTWDKLRRGCDGEKRGSRNWSIALQCYYERAWSRKLTVSCWAVTAGGFDAARAGSGDGWMRRSSKKSCGPATAQAHLQGATVSSHVVYSAKMVSTAASHSIGPTARKPRLETVPPLSQLIGPVGPPKDMSGVPCPLSSISDSSPRI